MNPLQSTKQEFAESVNPLALPGDLAFVSDFMNADGKAGLTIAAALDGRKLKKLARFMGCTVSGTQQELFNRIFLFKHTWLFIRSHTVATLSKLTNQELNNCLGAAQKGIANFTNKPQKVAHLFAWVQAVLGSIQIKAAEQIQERAIREAFIARQAIGIATAKAFDIAGALEQWGYEKTGDEYRHNGSVTIAYNLDGQIVPLETFTRLLDKARQELEWKQTGLKSWWGRYADYHPNGTWPDRQFAQEKFPLVKRLIQESADDLRVLEGKYLHLLEIRNGAPVQPRQVLFQDEMPLLHSEP